MKNNILIEKSFGNITDSSPGMAILISRDGKNILQKYLGLLNLDTNKRISSNTAFRLASLTKQFTAMAIMILKEKKLLNYDDKLGKFFPDFPEFGQNITIRQLLTHCSGIPDHEKPLYEKIKPGEEPTIYDSLDILKQQKRLLFKSGSKNHYSDAGYVLLAIIIEMVSCSTYSDFLYANVFVPLKMNNTTVLDESKPDIKNKAIGYKKLGNRWLEYDYDPLNCIVGCEGIYSTTKDLARWSQAWFNNILVSEATLKEALTPINLSDGSLDLFGFGWSINNEGMITTAYQQGTWVGFSNIIFMDYKSKTSIILLSNIANDPKNDQRLKLASDIFSYMLMKKNSIKLK